jgi:hypothetical protein
MTKQEQIKFLETLHGSIHQHHATNLCKSEYLFDHSKTILAMLSQLRIEVEDEEYLKEASTRSQAVLKIGLHGLLFTPTRGFKTIAECNTYLESEAGSTSGMLAIVDGIVYTVLKSETMEEP